MLKKSVPLLFKMNIKNIIVVVALSLAIVFLLMDKCGSDRKADELKGEYKKAIEIVEVEKRIKEETIKKQNKIIEKQDLLIAESRKEVEIKNTHISRLGNTVAELEDEFGNLTDKDEKIANLVSQISIWKQKFTLTQSIIADKDKIIFSLNEKYESQLKITNSYKAMYESIQGIVGIRTKQVKELEKINRRLKLTSGLKTGIVLTMAGVVLYSLLKD